MLLGVLGSQHSTQGKAFTTMSIVGDGYQVSIRIIADGMDARYLTTADMIHTQILLVSGILLPSLLAPLGWSSLCT